MLFTISKSSAERVIAPAEPMIQPCLAIQASTIATHHHWTSVPGLDPSQTRSEAIWEPVNHLQIRRSSEDTHGTRNINVDRRHLSHYFGQWHSNWRQLLRIHTFQNWRMGFRLFIRRNVTAAFRYHVSSQSGILHTTCHRWNKSVFTCSLPLVTLP